MPTTSTTEINQLLSPDRIRIGLPGSSKSEIINGLVDVLAGHPSIDSIETVRRAIFAREQMMSTGVGKGLGLPHAKTDAAQETIAAFATTKNPVDFGAIDDEPVHLLLLLVGPEADKSHHIKILGRISRLVSRDDLRTDLRNAASSEDVLRLLKNGEDALRR
ncbi:PTS sugar transporter subunit IIA [Longibacter salinarum]|uniref:PTS sugar transporter subunit IIA n=1 Tax=Longibacter salinarum TaxID=1850348 RepID=A0A2A8D126_9BACT|nr:PTS sugar transporter subunit IIA [Longibacter salinarum]PEN14635.1 PTS sugar transporter subunit IIA [Longibacter salinarum]